MPIAHQVEFIRRYLEAPQTVGAVLPSSRQLALALAAPFADHEKPARVLEVGAGTGAVTRVLGDLLGPDDRLDVCEIEPSFADILDREVLSRDSLAKPRQEGRVRLLRMAVEEIQADRAYDFIVSCLPFTAFALEDVNRIIGAMRLLLAPGGTLSYFEYAGLRRLRRALSIGRHRAEVSRLSAYLDDMIDAHQYSRTTVWRNIPPAFARHLHF